MLLVISQSAQKEVAEAGSRLSRARLGSARLWGDLMARHLIWDHSILKTTILLSGAVESTVGSLTKKHSLDFLSINRTRH